MNHKNVFAEDVSLKLMDAYNSDLKLDLVEAIQSLLNLVFI